MEAKNLRLWCNGTKSDALMLSRCIEVQFEHQYTSYNFGALADSRHFEISKTLFLNEIFYSCFLSALFYFISLASDATQGRIPVSVGMGDVIAEDEKGNELDQTI